MLKKIAIAALLSALVSPVMAADFPFYIGADVGSTKIDDFSGRKSSIGVFAGYQFHGNFAVEGNYNNYATYKYKNVDQDRSQLAISLVSTMPITDGFSMFGRIGYNRLKISHGNYSGSESGSLLGVGVAYEINKNASVRLEIQRPAENLKSLNAGIAFRF